MESRYETILKLGTELIRLFRIGVISASLVQQLEVFEYYKKQLETTKKKSQAVLNTAVYFDLQKRQVYRIVKFMSEEIEV